MFVVPSSSRFQNLSKVKTKNTNSNAQNVSFVLFIINCKLHNYSKVTFRCLRIVGEMQGCVNKTSLFDKDLMFLCIFGLRGDKHELESQIGLRCATKIRESLSSMRNVVSVTVGVTTGITYCGVVGHILRREYTVIGTTVNKAARLMCAYNNKVQCKIQYFTCIFARS